MLYKVLCVCNFELEIEEGEEKQCPDCGRIYDDRGVLQN